MMYIATLLAVLAIGIYIGAVIKIEDHDRRIAELERKHEEADEYSNIERIYEDAASTSELRPKTGDTVYITIDRGESFHKATYYHTNDNGHFVYVSDFKDTKLPTFSYVDKLFTKEGAMEVMVRGVRI